MSSSLHIYIKENLIHYTNTVNCAIIYNIGDFMNARYSHGDYGYGEM